jgi:sulfonate transport system ATP-binding protein
MGEELVLLDEPFTGLDLSRKQKAYKLFASAIKKRGAAAVLVTHDVEEAWAMGERIIVLKDGQIALDLRPAYEGEIPRPYALGERVKAALVQALLQGEKEK